MSVNDSKIAHIVGKPKSIWNSLARSKLLIENDSNDPVIRVVIRKYVIGKTEELGSVEWNDIHFDDENCLTTHVGRKIISLVSRWRVISLNCWTGKYFFLGLVIFRTEKLKNQKIWRTRPSALSRFIFETIVFLDLFFKKKQ